MPLPENFIQELKMRNDIAEVAASYVNLKHSGRSMVGLCPFHSEKTPSFHIFPENGSFYCFGCGVGGDVITFVRRIENLDYMEAVRFLAQRAGMQVPENQVDDGLAKLKVRILEINRETARFFHQVLLSPEGKPGLDYLMGRGLSMATIRHFGLGFSPSSRFGLVDHLRKKGYYPQDMIQANVAVRSQSDRAVDRFFGRVMYPIIDLRGNVIAFGGRTLGDGKPKYLNTSDTPVFRKSDGLFAMNFAKNTGQERLILAEGYMDVIALHQAGFTNAVATLGTALTPEQARLMARYTKEIVISYDSDAAGQKAASRAIPMLREAGLLVKVLTIPGSKDPDEFIRSYGDQGPARFRQLLDRSGNDVEYRLQKIKAGCNLEQPDGRVAYLTGAAEVLATLSSKIEQEVYAGRLAEEMGIDRAAILSQVQRVRRKAESSHRQKEFRTFQQQSAGVRDAVNPEKSANLRAANAEEALIAFLLSHPEAVREVSRRLPPEKLVTSFNRRVYRAVLEKAEEGGEVDLTGISAGFSAEELSSVARMLAQHHEVKATMQDAKEYCNVILEESNRLDEKKVLTADAQDIQKYLQRLREQKK